MRNSLFVLVTFIFVGLLVGAGLTASGAPLPFSEQVNNPEASTLTGTENQYQLMALVVLVVLGSLGGMAAGMAGLFYFLNDNVQKLEEAEDSPMDFSLSTSGENSLGAFIQQNAFIIALTVGLLLVLLLVALALTTGAVL